METALLIAQLEIVTVSLAGLDLFVNSEHVQMTAVDTVLA